MRSSTFAWVVAALCVAAAAAAGAVLAAREVARGDAREGRATLRLEATQIASALKAEVQREEETIASAAAFLASALPLQASSAQATVQPRRPASAKPDTAAPFLAWARALPSPQMTLRAALAGHPGLALHVRHRAGFRRAVFAAGSAPADAQSTVVDLGDGWSARVWMPPVQTDMLGNGDALTALIAGGVASLLLAVLVFLLGTRERHTRVRRRGVEPGREALYDALTGLPNRTLTLDRAERMLARTGRQSGMLAGALLIDLDWFDDLNDKLGRAAGDELLGIVAGRLQSVVRAHDTVGYLGDDKFIALVESQARTARLDSLARRVMDALHKPVELRGFGPGIRLTASIGLAFGHYASIEDLMRDAQLALDDAKGAGKDRFTLFNANLRSRIEDRGVLEMELDAALRGGQLSLSYEPVLDLSTGETTALQAHVRWTHPKRGEIPSEDFMPLAHESGLIVPIGRWALEEACTQAAAWNVQGHRVSVLVPVSEQQLRRDGFTTDVRRALQQSGIEPALLTLAVPETSVIEDVADTAARLRELKALDVRVAIEDFGNGYAYRTELRELPVDLLRVQRGSLAAADDEDYRSWLLEAIVLFARDLSIDLVVSDVQSDEELSALKAMGCKLVQGPLIGAGVPADVVAQLLDQPSGSASGSEPGVESPTTAEPSAATLTNLSR